MKFRDLAPPGRDGPPRALRALGFIAMATVVASTLFTDPRPGFDGDGPLVILGIVLLVGGLVLSARRMEWFPGARFAGLAAVGIASLLFAAVQPDGAGYAGVYFVMAIGGIRLDRDAAIIVCGGTVVGLVAIQLVEGTNPAVIAGILFSVLPWFLVMRLIRRLGQNVEELRESRAAHAESAALAERSRVARELHDVLAHSLSALALQLEGTRLLARKSDADPEVIEGLERAHHLAVSGLGEARQAISALRGDDLPALEDLAGTFPGDDVQRERNAARALLRGAARALPHRPGGADQRPPPQRVRPRRAAPGLRGRRDDADRPGPRHVRARDRRPRLRADRHARARRAARRAPERRSDRRRLQGGAMAAGAVIRVLLADDQRVVREGLGTLLGLLDGIELVATAADGEEALQLSAEHNPDVVLMDLRMPRMDGIEAIRRLSARGTSAIALTTYADDASVLGALRAGARGYLTKDAGADQIRAAVLAVARGEAALDPAIQHHVLAAVHSPAPPSDAPDDLTPREIEVLTLIAEGLTNAEIAESPRGLGRHGQEPRQPHLLQDRRPRSRPGRRLRLRQRSRSGQHVAARGAAVGPRQRPPRGGQPGRTGDRTIEDHRLGSGAQQPHGAWRERLDRVSRDPRERAVLEEHALHAQVRPRPFSGVDGTDRRPRAGVNEPQRRRVQGLVEAGLDLEQDEVAGDPGQPDGIGGLVGRLLLAELVDDRIPMRAPITDPPQADGDAGPGCERNRRPRDADTDLIGRTERFDRRAVSDPSRSGRGRRSIGRPSRGTTVEPSTSTPPAVPVPRRTAAPRARFDQKPRADGPQQVVASGDDDPGVGAPDRRPRRSTRRCPARRVTASAVRSVSVA